MQYEKKFNAMQCKEMQGMVVLAVSPHAITPSLINKTSHWLTLHRPSNDLHHNNDNDATDDWEEAGPSDLVIYSFSFFVTQGFWQQKAPLNSGKIIESFSLN